MSENNVGCSCQSGAPIQLNDLVKEPTNTNISAPSTSPKAEGDKETNWYLPYMNAITEGKEVEEKKSPVALFYCAGASNVGQSTVTGCVETAGILGYNRVALLCLASISAGLKNMFNGAKNARGIVAVDGCPMSCAKRTLEKAELKVDQHLIVSKDLDVPKNFRISDAGAIKQVTNALVQAVLSID
ncbi:putative zinc-binding protein [Desulfosporosinus metallidurans]|nr:putative zinc-binding protein [Desulfosporosinus metallidurans]